MQRSQSSPLLAAIFAVLTVCLVPGNGAQAVVLNVPQSYATIQAAINAAASGDLVLVAPGTYAESVTMKDGVGLRGAETARTFLTQNGGPGPIITVSSAITASISTFTFLNASVGVQISGNASVLEITNNVFELGSSGTAVVEQSSPGVSVVNNVFYGNGTAVSRDDDILILNNLFANNGTAIADTSLLEANTTYNDFVGNTTDGPVGAFSIAADPIFVDPASHDFHVQEGSPCIDTGDPAVTDVIDGTPSDIGAYGGPNADPTPFPVQGLTVVSTTGTSIDLAWQPNRSYLVTNSVSPGDYWLYYGYAPGVYDGTDAFAGTQPSPFSMGTTTSFTVLDLSPPPSLVPPAPLLLQLIPGNTQLGVVWAPVSGATGYKVHYGAISPGEHAIDVGNVTSYAINGLTNGQAYQVTVSAYAPPKYYLVVTVFDNTLMNESSFSSQVTAPLAVLRESGWSGTLTERPDSLAPYPVLPNKGAGCFIATAAYGSSTSPEVLILRSFRDRYLLTSMTGRRFVEWYYRNSPAAAAFLNAHPFLKPVVRLMLLPAVGSATILTAAAAYRPVVLLGIVAVVVFIVVVRKRIFGRRSFVE